MKQTKKQILFLHGALGTQEDMNPLMDMIKELGHETMSFTFSGHGIGSSETSEFRIDYFSRELDSFLKKNNLQNIIIFGYSMGGYVALYHKAHFEDSPIEKIFTYGTKFNWSPNAVTKEIQLLNPDNMAEKFPTLANSLKEKHGERWKPLLRSTAHMMQNLEKLDGLTKEDLSDIEIPVIMLLGDQDRMVTTEETHLTGSWLHHSKFKTISHSKHELERTNLREIAKIIEDNLD